MFSRTSHSGSILVLILALVVAAVTPAAALEVSLVTKDVTLTIGDILFVTRDGLAPDRLYRAVVADEAGIAVANVEVKPDPDGILGPVPVWIGTGVVGCDHGADPAPGEYRFARFEEAEDTLKGRTFDLTLLDDATQASVARIPLRLVAAEQNLLFFSDAEGCPRSLYSPEEPVFMTGIRAVFDMSWLFVIEAGEEPLEVGDPLDDVREAPQEIRPGSSYFTEQVAGALVAGKVYDGALEPGEAVPNMHLPEGMVLGPKLCRFNPELELCNKEKGLGTEEVEVDD